MPVFVDVGCLKFTVGLFSLEHFLLLLTIGALLLVHNVGA